MRNWSARSTVGPNSLEAGVSPWARYARIAKPVLEIGLGFQLPLELCGFLPLGFLVGRFLPVQADLGIALAVGDAGHAEVHADLGALADEVGLELLHDVLRVLLGDVVQLGAHAEDVLSGQLDLALDLGELGAGDLADGAEFGRGIALVDVPADGTYELHDIDLL